MKVIVACDKFKGSATSAQISGAVRQGVLDACPTAQVVTVTVADGGDGTVEAVVSALAAQGFGARRVECQVEAPVPDMRQLTAAYAATDGCAVVELAAAGGLALVPPQLRDAMQASSVGAGQQIAHAIAGGCRRVMVGLGGSASTDGGTGLLSALGFKFLDSNGRELRPCGANLQRIAAVDDSHVSKAVRDTKFTLWTDVTNPLCGPNGSAAVFAPQKGADAAQVAELDSGLRHLATLMPRPVACKPGAGAAGGVGAGLMAWLGADVRPGANAVLSLARFETLLTGASLVITGEGRIDSQTAAGKAPAEVLHWAHARRVPVAAICGSLAADAANLGFDAVLPIVPCPMSLAEAMQTVTTLAGARRTAAQIVSLAMLQP